MKKKYLYSLLALVLAVCGFTAWSAVAGGLNPLAEGETTELNPVLDKCVPAEDGTVKELSYILLTFPESETDIKLNPDFTKSALGTVGHWNTSSGGFQQSVHPIKKSQAANFDKMLDGKEVASNQIVYHLDTPVTADEAGEYSITFGAGVFISGATGNTNPQFKYSFNIDPNYSDTPEPLTINTEACVPAEGASVNGLKDIVLTFAKNQTNIKVNPEYTSSVFGIVSHKEGTSSKYDEMIRDKAAFDNLLNGEPVEANQIVIHLQNPITVEEARTYSIQIMANVLISETTGGLSQSIRYDFTIEPAAPEPLTFNTEACVPAKGGNAWDLSCVVLTFAENETDIMLNPDHTGQAIGLIRQTNGGLLTSFKLADADNIITYEINGEPLAPNQIGLKISNPISVDYLTQCTLLIYKNTFKSGATGGVNEEQMEFGFNMIPTPGELVPVVATEPAAGSTVSEPVKTLIFTWGAGMDCVEFVWDLESYGTIENVQTGEIVENLSQNYFEFEANGEALNDDQIAYVLKTPLEAGTYKVSVNARVFKNMNAPRNENEAFEFTFTVKGDDDPAGKFDYGFSYASWGVSNNYDYTYRRVDNSFTTNVTFLDLPANAALDASVTSLPWIRESDGTVVKVSLKKFLDSFMMFTESASWPSDPYGVWTCVLPQGLFTSGDLQSEEKTIRLTWYDPNAEPPRPDFEVTRLSFFNTPDCFANLEGKPAGVPMDMMYTLWATVEGGEDMMNWETDPKRIACLNSNRGFVINTNWDEWIQCFIAEVKRKDGQGEIDVWNQDAVQEIYGYGSVCKNYVGSSASDCEAYQHPLLGCGGNEDTREYADGVEYTMDIWFYDSMVKCGMDNSAHTMAVGSYHLEFTGATVPFVYSDSAHLVSIDPVPVNLSELGITSGAAPGEVTRVNQPITFTWSAPVTMTAQYSLGSTGGLANLESCTSNADGTVWTVVPGPDCISNGEGGYLDLFEFDVQAIDADGLYVKGNVGEKRNTMFVPQFKFREVEVVLESTPTIASDASICEIGMAGFSVSNEVTLEPGTQISLYAGDGETPVKEVPVRTSFADGVTILFGDFSTDGQPYVLENGKEYTLRIAADMVTDNVTKEKYGEMVSSFKGASAAAAEYVTLTTDISGLAISNTSVVKSETVILNLVYPNDWKIATVTYNGEDVTDQVVNNTYTTPSVMADAMVEVAYKYAYDVISGVNDANEVLGALKLNVWSQNGGINVRGLNEGMIVNLYSIDGLHVAEMIAEGSSVKFSNVAPGTYLIVVEGNNGVKEAVKLLHQ